MGNKYLIGALLLILAFLAGFLPQYVKSARLESELKQATRQNEQAQLRDLAGLIYIQAAQKNFGLAAQTSTQFFNRVQAAAGKAEGTQQKSLEEIFGFRDKITAELARGDSGVLDDLQNLVLRTRAATAP